MRSLFAKSWSVMVRAATVTVFGASLGAGVSAQAAGLLSNYGFEAPSNPGGNQDYNVASWNLLGDSERATFDHPPEGSWALWIKTFEYPPAYPNDPTTGATGGAYQTVPIVGGTTYTLTAQTFFEAGAPASGALINEDMIFLDSGGNAIGSPVGLQYSQANETTGTWQANDGQGLISTTAPANATQVEVLLDWVGGSTVMGQSQSAFFDAVDLEGQSPNPPGGSEWAVNGSGDWNVSGNWDNGTVPNGTGTEADFFSVLQVGNRTVYTDSAVTVGSLVFNNSLTYVIAGAGNITLQATTGNALVNVQQGTQEINVPLTLASNTTFMTASGATLVIADPITVNSGLTLSTSGSGTVTYESTVTLQSGAHMNISNSTYAHSLTVGASAEATVSPTTSGRTLVQLDSLSLAGSTGSWTGKFDLGNGDMMVHGGSLANVTDQIKSGYSNGTWNGSGGITSASAASDSKHLTTLGVIQGSSYSGSTFDGQSVASGDVLVKYTYYGDTNLDGKVDGTDYAKIDAGFAAHSNGWVNGDFNYDGKVDGSDYSLIDNAFNQQGAQISSAGSFATAAEFEGSAVPEPASLGLIALGALGVLARRRRA